MVAPCGVPMTIWISRKVRSKILISTEIGGPEPCGGKQSCKNYMDDFLSPRPHRISSKPLVADDGNFGVRNFEPHQAVIGVEQEKNLEVGSVDLEAFVGFTVGSGGSSGLHGDGTGR